MLRGCAMCASTTCPHACALALSESVHTSGCGVSGQSILQSGMVLEFVYQESISCGLWIVPQDRIREPWPWVGVEGTANVDS
jgi:hypothetical protein